MFEEVQCEAQTQGSCDQADVQGFTRMRDLLLLLLLLLPIALLPVLCTGVKSSLGLMGAGTLCLLSAKRTGGGCGAQTRNGELLEDI